MRYNLIMKVVLPLLSIAIIPVLFSGLLYLFFHSETGKKLSSRTKQLIAGIIFGIIAICGTEFGVNIDGAIINARDAAPLCAGLLFGPLAGILSGLIGGIERWFAVLWGAGTYTRLACTISTILAGLIAATLRKYILDNKNPLIDQALIIGIVVEVIHMVMIFITNISDVRRAFSYVEACSIPMVTINALAVAAATLFVSLIKARTKKTNEKELPTISNSIQRNLIVVLLFGCITTSLFGYILQDQISSEEINRLLSQNIIDAVDDVEDQCDKALLRVNHLVADIIVNNPEVNLQDLKQAYNVHEINIVNKNGIITKSTETKYIGFEMATGDQSAEFLKLLSDYTDIEEIVQPYLPTSYHHDVYLKYSGVRIPTGLVQVAYNDEQMSQEISSLLSHVASNRHIGQSGSLLVLDGNNIISCTNDSALNPKISNFYKVPLDLNTVEEFTVHQTTIRDVPYYYMYTRAENYYVAGFIPQSEADFTKTMSSYLTIFTQIIVFGGLISVIYFITKKLIVDNIRKVNKSLNQITEGNLETVVEVGGSKEFTSLSAGINTTVDALKKYIAEANTRIDNELRYAREIQASSLPSTFPAFPSRDEFDIYALMVPAKEVGGDFYDFFLIDNDKLAFSVADVSGKGIPASLFMMRAKTILKTYAERGIQVADIFTNANYNLCEGNDAGMFVTAWMGILDLKTGVLKYANAGHNPPMLCKGNGTYEFLTGPNGFILGGMEGIVYKEQEITLEPGDELFLYTDGVVEATNLDNELYGNDRLKECINQHRGEDAMTLCNSIKKDVDTFYGEAPQFDDITELSLQFKKYSQ